MKIAAFALGATQAFSLVHRHREANITAAAVHGNTTDKDRIDPEPLSDNEKKEYGKVLGKLEADSELAPLEGSCEHNTMRCIYVHELPDDYCHKTNQVNWCVDYYGKAACVMVKNYDKYVDAMMDEGSSEEEAREKLSGETAAEKEAQCFSTRGWGIPNPANLKKDLPSCKSRNTYGTCQSHAGDKSYKCPGCGDGKARDGGAAADNDVMGGGMSR